MKIVVIVMLVGCLVGQVEYAFAGKNTRLPKEFSLCKPGDDVCLTGAISNALKLLRAGVPNIGALPVDPLHVTEMKVIQGTGSASIDITFTNLDIFGISDLEVKSAKGEFGDKSYRLQYSGKIPSITLYGDYTIKGKLSIFPIHGAGKENLTYSDMDFTATLTGHVIDKQGVDYVIIDDAKFEYTPVRLSIHLGNLFDGNQELGDNMNKFLNENWKELLPEVHPAAEEALGKVMKAMAARVYEKVPYRHAHPKE